MTQETLAEMVGVSSETVGRIERGTVVPGLRTLDRIARALGADLADLVRRREGSTRRDAALERVLVVLRSRPVEDVELVAEILERIARQQIV